MTNITSRPLGLFDYQQRLEELSQRPSALTHLAAAIDWERFRAPLTEAVVPPAKGPGGRPRFDVVLMFKVLVLQRTFNLSDEQTEIQILDRFSFQQFLRMTVADSVPDQNTIWEFRERLRESGVEAKLWETFNLLLGSKGLVLTPGKIVDASFVDVPRQRNSREENKAIKKDERPAGWSDDSPARLRQKDTDARWAVKGPETHFGYKNHIKIDVRTKLIERHIVTTASLHESQVADQLFSAQDGIGYGDKAYDNQHIDGLLASLGITNKILRQGRSNAALTPTRKRANRRLSRVRARIEHVFGFMVTVMRADRIRCIGLPRASFLIGLNNLLYNLHRLAYLTRAT